MLYVQQSEEQLPADAATRKRGDGVFSRDGACHLWLLTKRGRCWRAQSVRTLVWQHAQLEDARCWTSAGSPTGLHRQQLVLSFGYVVCRFGECCNCCLERTMRLRFHDWTQTEKLVNSCTENIRTCGHDVQLGDFGHWSEYKIFKQKVLEAC